MDVLALKHRLVVLTDVSPDGLHMLAGIAIYLTLAMVLDRRVSSWRALVLTAAVAVAGEAIDWSGYRLRGELIPWTPFLVDLRDALLWPLILMIVGEWLAAVGLVTMCDDG